MKTISKTHISRVGRQNSISIKLKKAVRKGTTAFLGLKSGEDLAINITY